MCVVDSCNGTTSLVLSLFCQEGKKAPSPPGRKWKGIRNSVHRLHCFKWYPSETKMQHQRKLLLQDLPDQKTTGYGKLLMFRTAPLMRISLFSLSQGAVPEHFQIIFLVFFGPFTMITWKLCMFCVLGETLYHVLSCSLHWLNFNLFFFLTWSSEILSPISVKYITFHFIKLQPSNFITTAGVHYIGPKTISPLLKINFPPFPSYTCLLTLRFCPFVIFYLFTFYFPLIFLLSSFLSRFIFFSRAPFQKFSLK